MINLMVLGLLFLAVLSTASFSFISMTESTQTLVDAQTEKNQLKKIGILINNNLIPNQNDGSMIAPVGENIFNDHDGDLVNDTPIHTIPLDLSQRAINTWGKPYVYCPIGSRTASLTLPTVEIQLKMSDSIQSQYNGGVISSKGRSFVAESDIQLDPSLDGMDVSYILMSPLRGDISQPSCDQVVYDSSNNQFTAPNALVIVETQDKISNETGFLSKVEKTNDTDSLDINQHIGSWKSATTLSYKLDLPTSDFTATEDIDFCLPDDTYRRQIIISGKYDSGSVTTINANGNKLKLCNVSVTIKDIGLVNTNIETNNAKVIIDNSAISTLSLTDSDAYLKNTVLFDGGLGGYSIHAVNSKVSMSNGSYTFSLGADGESQLKLVGSSAYINNSTLTFNTDGAWVNSSSIISADSLSNIQLKDTILNAEVKALNVISSGGKLVIENTSIAANVSNTDLISNNYGGMLTMTNGSTLSCKSGIGIIDNGGAGYFGDLSTISATKCWSGEAFSDTASNSTGSSESLTSYMQLNRSKWSCNP